MFAITFGQILNNKKIRKCQVENYPESCTEGTVQNLDSGDWTDDWTLDSIMDLRFGPEFRLPGVKGHMHINQQQSFEYNHFVGCRVCTHCLCTDWIMKCLCIYL